MLNQPTLAKVDHSAQECVRCGEGGDSDLRCTCLLQYPAQQAEGVKPLAKKDLRTTLQ
nr:hypothetical protein [uncultured Prevotella sp.]